MRSCHFTPSFVSKHGHMLSLCSTEENKDIYQMLQSWQQDKQEDQMGWRWLKQKPDAEAIFSTINILSLSCVPSKKGDPLKSHYIFTQKLSKNMLMVCLQKYTREAENQFCFFNESVKIGSISILSVNP